MQGYLALVFVGRILSDVMGPCITTGDRSADLADSFANCSGVIQHTNALKKAPPPGQDVSEDVKAFVDAVNENISLSVVEFGKGIEHIANQTHRSRHRVPREPWHEYTTGVGRFFYRCCNARAAGLSLTL